MAPLARFSKAAREGGGSFAVAVDRRSLICLYSYSAHKRVRTPCNALEEPFICKSHDPKRPEGLASVDTLVDPAAEILGSLWPTRISEAGNSMLKVVLSLRVIMLVASIGAVLGAGLMFWLGFAKLLHSAHAAFVLETPNAKAVTVGVMGATDAFLFGVVLIIFAVAIAFGFVFELPEQSAARLPAWMRVNGIGELKHTLVEVILIYLIVDFATDIAEGEGHLSWRILVMPLSILLIAGSLRLMGARAPET
jgi:uncharacterized membrane protein YqhA